MSLENLDAQQREAIEYGVSHTIELLEINNIKVDYGVESLQYLEDFIDVNRAVFSDFEKKTGLFRQGRIWVSV